MGWLRKQYDDIKGNLKWAIIWWLVAGSGITWLFHTLQAAMHANISSWLSLAAPIFSILAVFYLLMVFAPKKGANTHLLAADSQDNPSSHTMAPPPELLPAPLPVDLQGEIEELYFLNPPAVIPFSTVYILMRVQIVNRGPDEVTITQCGLNIRIGDWQQMADSVVVPDSWRIKKIIEGTFNIAYEEIPIKARLGVNPHNEIYKKGIPLAGWIAFAFMPLQSIEFPNAEFVILLKDSLGGKHRIQRKPMLYKKTGEIVTATP